VLYDQAATLSGADFVLGLAFLLLVANAARRGFLREGSLLLGLAAALWLAGRLYRGIAPEVPALVGDGPWPALIYLLLAFVLVVVACAVSALAAPSLRSGPLRLVDRLLGCTVGAAEAAVLIGLLVMVAQRAGALQVAVESPAARAVQAASVALAWLRATVPPDVLPGRLL
jgi:uncharacterized membrane protein required for colicin V production